MASSTRGLSDLPRAHRSPWLRRNDCSIFRLDRLFTTHWSRKVLQRQLITAPTTPKKRLPRSARSALPRFTVDDFSDPSWPNDEWRIVSSTDDDSVGVELHDDGVAVVTRHAPPNNYLSVPSLRLLADRLEDLDIDERCRVTVLR